jgi:hypothetical protein
MSTSSNQRQPVTSEALTIVQKVRDHLEAIEAMREAEAFTFCPFPIGGRVVDSDDGSHHRHGCQLANLETELFRTLAPRLLEPSIACTLRSVEVSASDVFRQVQQYCELFRRSEWCGSRADSAPALPLFSRFLRDRVVAVLDRAEKALQPEECGEAADECEAVEARRPSVEADPRSIAPATVEVPLLETRFLRAGTQFKEASKRITEAGGEPTPKACYRWLMKDREPGDDLPDQNTWLRYVRDYLKATEGRSRHRRTLGISRSVVRFGST